MSLALCDFHTLTVIRVDTEEICRHSLFEVEISHSYEAEHFCKVKAKKNLFLSLEATYQQKNSVKELQQ